MVSPSSKADDFGDTELSSQFCYEHSIVSQCLLSTQVPHVLWSEGGATIW